MMRAKVLGWLLLLAWAGTLHASGLRLGSVLGESSDDGFLRADTPRRFEFPRDHGAHPEYRSEWWYLTASLHSAAGERFGVQFTLFRQGLRSRPRTSSPWDASQIYLGHLAITDVAAGKHLHGERLSRAHPRLAGVVAEPFHAWLDGWNLQACGPDLRGLALQGATADFSVSLQFEPVKPIVLQGDAGLSAKGPGQASYYYTVPRLRGSGALVIGDRRIEVSGSAWLDREWSTSLLSEGQVGWDWFGLQLDSGAELMAFQLRRQDGVRDPYDQGAWVGRDGDSTQLRTQDFTLRPLRWWRDSAGVRWPVAWEISVMTPQGPRVLRVEAAVDDQLMDTLFTYWEGLVTVYDEAGASTGTGYMELTGYE